MILVPWCVWSRVLVGEDVAHGYPDVLDLDCLIQELLPLALLRVLPVSIKPAVEWSHYITKNAGTEKEVFCPWIILYFVSKT